MPKMKSHSGTKKRFKVTGSGKVRGRSAFTSHILEKKSPKRKRRQAEAQIITGEDAKRIKKMIGKGNR
jgi:large subunit ribosomal protein L35